MEPDPMTSRVTISQTAYDRVAARTIDDAFRNFASTPEHKRADVVRSWIASHVMPAALRRTALAQLDQTALAA
jgi:hypothetical protein